MPDIEMIFDFASPNAYLAHKVLPQMAAKAGVKVTYSLCLLGGIFKLTNNQAPMMAFAHVSNKLAYERLEFRRFVQRHDLHGFTWNKHFPVNSVMLMRGAVAAEQEGTLAVYLEAGLKAMWEESEDMSDPTVFAAVLERHGLDGQHFLTRAGAAEIKAALMAQTQDAVDRGAFGVPTFYVGSEMFFGKERLDQVIEAACR